MATRKKKAIAGPSKTRKFNGKTYKHTSCSSTKTGAAKTARALRAKGKNARVVKTAGKHCVYARG